MLQAILFIYIIVVFFVTSPVAAHAFWGADSDGQSGLNLETGYDANTVSTISGRIVSLQVGAEYRKSSLVLENNGTQAIVVLGPHRYWAEFGIELKAGDLVTVRGSKALGKDGKVYVLAQKFTDTSQNTSVTLRNESGHPAWVGGGMSNGQGRMNNRPAQQPGRMGGGRIGR